MGLPLVSVKDRFFAANILPRETVELPELSLSVVVRAMTAGERDEFESNHAKNPDANFRARLAAASVCNESGARMFAPEDIPNLAGMNAAALDRIVEAASRLSRFTNADIEQLEGNSDASPSADSASSSASSSGA